MWKNLIFFCKIDIKSAYDSCPIHKQDRPYLQFSVENCIYQYKGWPNGLSEAPRLFTLLLKPVLATFGKLSMRSMMFLDDLLIMNQNRDMLLRQCAFAVQLLSWLGFTVSSEKSILTPCQSIEYLGMIVDSCSMSMFLPDRKVTNIIDTCSSVYYSKILGVKELASLVGKMQAAWPAIQLGPFHYRELQKILIEGTSNGNWKNKVIITTEAKLDLKWWINNVRSQNGRSFLKSPIKVRITTDASNLGWGAFCHGKTAQGPWTVEEKNLHINIKELIAAEKGLKSLIHQENITVALAIDNTTALTYISKMGGTRSKVMTKISKQIWEWCKSKGITLIPSHIPGKENTNADKQSREIRDSGDWKLKTKIFKQLQQLRGPLNIDLFSMEWNKQLPQFYSWGNQPHSMGQDALSFSWEKTGNYAFPPFILINKVIQKIMMENVRILLITPLWQTAPWYSKLSQLSYRNPILLPQIQDLLSNSQGEPHPLVKERRLRLAAWSLSGKKSDYLEFQKQWQTLLPENTGKIQRIATTTPGINGIAGVAGNKFLRFQRL